MLGIRISSRVLIAPVLSPEPRLRESSVIGSLTCLHYQLRKSIAGEFLATAVAFALFLALTPCCEVDAATSAPTQIRTDVYPDGHGTGDDHGTPISSDSCAAWTNDNAVVIDGSALLPKAEYDPPLQWFREKEIETIFQAPSSPPISLHPPPAIPIYLLFVHLLF